MNTPTETLAAISALLDKPDDPYLSLKIAHAMGRRIEIGDDHIGWRPLCDGPRCK